MNTVEALVKGRDFLKENKWGRNAYSDNGTYCAVGALYCGVYGADYWESGTAFKDDLNTVRAAEYLLHDVAPRGSVTEFNDEVAKRKRDVISIYNKAIKLAQEKSK